MKLLISFFIFLLLADLGFWGYYYYQQYMPPVTPVSSNAKSATEPKPLQKYAFPRLRDRPDTPSDITMEKELEDEDDYMVYLFSYRTEGDKKVSGVAHVPKKATDAPVIVMFRGFVPPASYYPGMGTSNYAKVLASEGFITLAPDFLDHGDSDLSSEVPLEGRFETYTTALDMLASVENLPSFLQTLEDIEVTADTRTIGLWGHSNGGHISLSVLAITGKPYPTILWNPVTKHFPYSVMFYMDEFEDQGKILRKFVANFEQDYDIGQYSPPNYYQYIRAPIQLHQGAADDIVPQKWSNQVVAELEGHDIAVEYVVHPGADHNLAGGTGWQDAAKQGMDFYTNAFEEDDEE